MTKCAPASVSLCTLQKEAKTFVDTKTIPFSVVFKDLYAVNFHAGSMSSKYVCTAWDGEIDRWTSFDSSLIYLDRSKPHGADTIWSAKCKCDQ